MLQTDGLSKSYGKTQALKGVKIEVPQGSVFGILGPNGSGKTTFLSTVLRVLRPSSGHFQWFDGSKASPADLRKRLGTLLETPNYYPYLSGAQNLAITATIRGCSPAGIPSILEQVGLQDAAKVPFKNYSLGMKQRLALAGCLVGEPEVLVLDEPTNGLDPAGIADVRNLISELNQKGHTIILASHLLDQVEKVCTHVAILKKGKLIEMGPMELVLSEDPIIDLGASNLEALRTALESFEPSLHIRDREDGLRVTGQVTPEDLNQYCFEQGLTLDHLSLQKKNLESRFLELTDD